MAARIWITWETQRRNVTTSQALGCKLFKFDFRYHRAIRYPIALVATCWTFAKERPELIFVQNPSVVLTTFAILYGRTFGIPVIADTHNSGVEPLRQETGWERAISIFLLRHASLTIVSNQGIARTIQREASDSAVAILPDPIPELPAPSPIPSLRGEKNVLFICTWAPDEPYLEVIKAASLLPPTTCIYITGRPQPSIMAQIARLPANVVLTGYLDEGTYVGMLRNCDAIVDLTTWDDCLVCGAYEAVAAERTALLSDKAALKEHFRLGMLFTDNTADDIAVRIQEVLDRKPQLDGEVRSLKGILTQEWRAHRDALDTALDSLQARRRGVRQV